MKIGLCGYTGKMGKAVIKKLALYQNVTLVRDHDREENLELLCQISDVVIDFSAPELTSRLITTAAETNTPLVSGTTGLSEETHQAMKKASKFIPIFWSPNMSLAIHLLKSYAKHAVQALDNVDIEILDIHHRYKKDAPSGTALMLAQAVAKKPSDIVMRRDSAHAERKSGEVGIASIRGGSTTGRHEVMLFTDDEMITLSHQSFNRGVYAEGAIKAALWLIKQKPGLYSMDDLITLSPTLRS